MRKGGKSLYNAMWMKFLLFKIKWNKKYIQIIQVNGIKLKKNSECSAFAKGKQHKLVKCCNLRNRIDGVKITNKVNHVVVAADPTHLTTEEKICEPRM